MLRIYSDSVQENSVWSDRVSQFSRLNEFAAAVNAPGNDAFDSDDVEIEKRRLAIAYEEFQQASAAVRDDLRSGDPSETAPLFRDLRLTEKQVTRIHLEAIRVFADLENKNQEAAGARMAEMDRCFSRAIGMIGTLCEDVRGIQAARFNLETARARRLGSFEFAIVGAVCLILCVATWYGYKMAGYMRQGEKRNRNNEQRLKSIVDTALDPIITITGEGRIESFNPAAERVFGYSVREMLGENIKMLMPSPYQEEHDGYLSRYLATGESTVIGRRREVVAQKKDGTTFPMSLSVSKIIIGNRDKGSPLLFTGFIRDLTEQKAMEAELIAREAAEASNQAKTEFLANMSHEIRTPMTAILGFSEVVLGNVSDPQNIEGLKTIQRNGEYLLKIINDILDISKIESGKLEVEQIECSPCQVLSDVASLMRVRASATGLPLEVEYEGPMPQHIRSDPTRLRQILFNLIGNAIKFTEVGKVQVVARLLDAGSDEPKMQFDIVDTGIGMTDQQIGKLFQPFVQADTSTTREFGGTGLGLTISKRLAEMLGGNIQVHSTPGEGSIFSVTVSTGSLEGVTLVDNMTDAEASTERVAKPTIADIRLACRILLAEDGPDNQRLISFILKKAGAEVTVAENGQIALDLALVARNEGIPFDVILMDMQMPILDGYEATRKLREAGYVGSIIALTAHAMNSDRNKCLDAGCDDYMTKPIDRKKLISLAERYALPRTPGDAVHVEI